MSDLPRPYPAGAIAVHRAQVPDMLCPRAPLAQGFDLGGPALSGFCPPA